MDKHQQFDIAKFALPPCPTGAFLLRDGRPIQDVLHIALPGNFGYLAIEMKKIFVDAHLNFITDSPTEEEQARTLARSKTIDVVIVEIHSEQTLEGLAKGQVNLGRKMMRCCGEKLIVTGLTAPMVLERLPLKSAAVLAFHAMPASQIALARALSGDFRPAGVMPVQGGCGKR